MTTSLTNNALKRRIKKYFPKEKLEIFIPCPTGLVEVAKQDLSLLNLNINCVKNEGLQLTGDWKTVYALNLHSGVGNRVLVRIAEFYVGSYPELFQKLKRIHWEVFIGNHSAYSLKISAKKSRLHHTGNIGRTCEECIENTMNSFELNIKNSKDASIKFYIRIFQDRCQISLDTTGDHLYKRGYRKFVGNAPIRENIVRGLLKTAGELPNILVDPFCGSGTIAFEYIFLKWNQAPGLIRKFSFEDFPYFQKKRWQDLKDLAREKIHKTPLKVFLNDLDKNVITELQKEIRILQLEEFIELKNMDFNLFLEQVAISEKFILISNLPYGKRINIPLVNMFNLLKKELSRLQENVKYGLIIEKEMYQMYKEVFNLESDRETAKTLKFKNGGLNTLFLLRNDE
ncbi:MAG: hypothetical protein COA79_04965 [Planctomycetota bacterium]|nr:MAG: hypothetical protein COA79_04965 [Planctomycetota bacterium]